MEGGDEGGVGGAGGPEQPGPWMSKCPRDY